MPRRGFERLTDERAAKASDIHRQSPLTYPSNPLAMSGIPLRVLVVEDHADIRLVLGMLLDGLGHRAEFAVDAGAALAITRERKFDVLLTDIGLPGRDGWELVRELTVRGCLPPLVISMSASNTGQEPAQSRAAGCRAHLLKPFKPQELTNALQTADPTTSGRTDAAKAA